MHINHFTQAVKEINERTAQVDTSGARTTFGLTLSNGESVIGSIQTFDRNGLIIMQDEMGGNIYLAVEDVVTISRTV